jgi:hypothetical protein
MRFIAFALLVFTSGCIDFRTELFACFDAGGCTANHPADGGARSRDGGTPDVFPFCSGGGWCFQAALPVHRVNDILPLAPNDVWAFEELGTQLHFDGTRWTQADAPFGDYWRAQVSTPGEFLVATSAGLLRWKEGAYSTVSGHSDPITDLIVNGPDDYWTYRYQNSTLTHTVQGSTTNLSIPERAPGTNSPLNINAMCAADGTAWFASDLAPVFRVRPDAGVLELFDGVPAGIGNGNSAFTDMWCKNADEVWVTSSNGFDFRTTPAGGIEAIGDGRSVLAVDGAPDGAVYLLEDFQYQVWSPSGSRRGSAASSGLCRHTVVRSGPGGTWFGDDCGQVARYEGGVVQVMGNGARANTETYYAAAGTSPSDIWVGGDNGVVSHFDGTSWSTSRALKGTLSSLATVVPGEVWATQRNFDDGSDTAIYRLLHLSNNIWAAEGPLVPVLNSVWIAPSGQVLAVGRRGTVLQAAPGAQPVLVPSFTTSELTGITGTSDSDVWVCGDHVLFHFDGTSWAPVAVTQDDWRSLVANGNVSGEAADGKKFRFAFANWSGVPPPGTRGARPLLPASGGSPSTAVGSDPSQPGPKLTRFFCSWTGEVVGGQRWHGCYSNFSAESWTIEKQCRESARSDPQRGLEGVEADIRCVCSTNPQSVEVACRPQTEGR